MTIELVDGKAGVAHISSEDKAIIHQAKFSKSDVVFDWGDAFKCTMGSANKATIGTGCASIQGLDWHITAAESVTISNGSQGMKRNDIICAHYHQDSKTGNENVELTVLKGSPNATAAADPTIPSGKILSGAVDAYMPLWRIPLDGITVGTPVRLFTPRWALWDSVTLEQQPFPFFGNVLRLQKHKGLVIATVSASPKSTSNNLYDVAVNETIANGFRPSSRDAIMTSVSHGGDVASVLIHPDGRISMFGTLTVGHHYLWQGVWPTE
ncbi:hypothetical protein CYJ39_02895 [Bifidobacterium longum]|uniref:hypothetical protein n=1 Tax=Bifidobacterium longum TaxID=216816 RepID=UPI000C758BCE|nr:hypothetical protein [Bifidobacterium longum]PKY77490.1 hypothetical protein CYJ39_02895 [Bifidobacterium longum]